MSSRPSFFSSSVGSKYLIAFTGLSLVGFLIAHLAGNLLVYVSPEAFNKYSDTLIKNPLVIPAELGLIALFLLHAYKAVRMFVGAREARPVGYAMKEGAGLMSSARGAKVSFSNGKPTVIDGPFAEAKELIAGYSIIEAASLAEVIEMVMDWPQSDGHGNAQIEIRQIATAESLGFDEEQLDRYNRLVTQQQQQQ